MECKYYILHEDEESSMFVKKKNSLSHVCQITSTVVQVFLAYGASYHTNHNTSCLCLKNPTNQKTTEVKWT
jgi:hypothetical protein